MNIAYLIMVHKNPKLLERTITALSSDRSSFFVHLDLKSDIREFSFAKGENVFFLEQRVPVYWGEFSQVDATKLMVRHALNCSSKFDYFVLMQGSDYPIRSSGYIEKFLERNRGKEFINSVKMPAPGYPFSKINTLRYPSDRPILRFTTRVLAKLGLAQRDWTRYLGQLQPYAGSGWWALSREACEYILRFADNNPKLEAFFRKTFTSDEMFFHTILGNSPLQNRIHRSVVYADWSVSRAHPAVLTGEHIALLEKQDKVWVDDEWGAEEMLFARKFSDENLEVVDRVDSMIRRKEQVRTSPRPQVPNACASTPEARS